MFKHWESKSLKTRFVFKSDYVQSAVFTLTRIVNVWNCNKNVYAAKALDYLCLTFISTLITEVRHWADLLITFICHVFWLQFMKCPDGVPKVFTLYIIYIKHIHFSYRTCALVCVQVDVVWVDGGLHSLFWLNYFTEAGLKQEAVCICLTPALDQVSTINLFILTTELRWLTRSSPFYSKYNLTVMFEMQEQPTERMFEMLSNLKECLCVYFVQGLV